MDLGTNKETLKERELSPAELEFFSNLKEESILRNKEKEKELKLLENEKKRKRDKQEIKEKLSERPEEMEEKAKSTSEASPDPAQPLKSKKEGCPMREKIEALEVLVEALILSEIGGKTKENHDLYLDSRDIIYEAGLKIRNLRIRSN
jgi:hypothetical protein